MLYSCAMHDPGLVRIGELSRRSGVSPELLRAWERRYRLLRPTRSQGGLRLYSPDDLERVRLMQHHLARGLAAAEAAALATEQPRAAPNAETALADAKDELADAFASFDEARAHALLDSLLATATIDSVLAVVVIPFLHELGERWERGEASVAQEHFASTVIRGRLLGLARGWGAGSGPLALLACPPGEEHDLGLLTLGVVLHARGWRVAYLGPDTPMETLAQAAKNMRADWVVLAALSAKRFRAVEHEIADLSGEHRVALAGSGASADLAQKSGALFLPGGPVDEAKRLAGTIQPQRAH
jgi:MerR family transcriptional regulator, light-induced transcriptional regulator